MSYDINSIQSLTFKQGVRTRIQMYLGSDDIEGTYQALKEIINNSTDEALAGYGKKIEIAVDETLNKVSVRDYGRSVPFGIRENGENVLVSIYSQSHTGAKFGHDAYKNASGLNGVGGSCVCLSALNFIVRSFRDGSYAEAIFHKGDLISYKEGKTKDKTGTYVEFIPDPEVFSNGEIGYSFERICNDIKDISYLYSGIEFVVSNGNETKSFCAKNGIVDFITEQVTKPLHKHIITGFATDGTDSIEIAFQWGSKNETPYVFVNGLRCPELGTPATGAKTAITKTFNNLAKSNFEGEYIRRNLFYVMNCKVENPSFANQTKSKINTASLRQLASTAFTNALKEMSIKYSTEFNTIVELLKKIEKSEEAANRAREAILAHEKTLNDNAKKRFSAPIKLMDCEKHGQNSILYITEGKSAKTPVQNARQIEYEAVYDIRGKIIGALKNPIEKVLENEEVSDILQILGCGIFEKYNPKKLNFGKLLIFSDRDPDGAAISNLIVTLIYVLFPDFIKEGRLGRVIPPLYRLKKGKQSKYFYSREEYEREKDKYPGWDSTYYKGIGECSSEDMRNTMFNEKERRVSIYKAEDFDKFSDLINLLMGDDVPPRRQYIFDNIDFHKLRSE